MLRTPAPLIGALGVRNMRRRAFLAAIVGAATTIPFGRSDAMEAPMTPDTSEDGFRNHLKSRDKNLGDLNTATLVAEALSFYELKKCTGLSVDAESDMLLYQWGAYDWGNGKHFEFNITRQFIASDAEGDDVISQLSITALFAPREELSALKSGNHWCKNVEELGKFRDYIEGSSPFIVLSNSKPEALGIEW